MSWLQSYDSYKSHWDNNNAQWEQERRRAEEQRQRDNQMREQERQRQMADNDRRQREAMETFKRQQDEMQRATHARMVAHANAMAVEQAKLAQQKMNQIQEKVDKYEQTSKDINELYKSLENIINLANSGQLKNLQETSKKLKDDIFELVGKNEENSKLLTENEDLISEYATKLKNNDEKLRKIIKFIDLLCDNVTKHLIKLQIASQ